MIYQWIAKDLVNLKFAFLQEIPLSCGWSLSIGMAHHKARVKRREFVSVHLEKDLCFENLQFCIATVYFILHHMI